MLLDLFYINKIDSCSQMSSIVVETVRLADFSCLFPSLPVTGGLRQMFGWSGQLFLWWRRDAVIGCNYTVSHDTAKVHVALKFEGGQKWTCHE